MQTLSGWLFGEERLDKLKDVLAYLKQDPRFASQVHYPEIKLSKNVVGINMRETFGIASAYKGYMLDGSLLFGLKYDEQGRIAFLLDMKAKKLIYQIALQWEGTLPDSVIDSNGVTELEFQDGFPSPIQQTVRIDRKGQVSVSEKIPLRHELPGGRYTVFEENCSLFYKNETTGEVKKLFQGNSEDGEGLVRYSHFASIDESNFVYCISGYESYGGYGIC